MATKVWVLEQSNHGADNQLRNCEISRTQENGDSFMLIVAIIGYDMISFNNEKRKGNCFYLVLCDCQSWICSIFCDWWLDLKFQQRRPNTLVQSILVHNIDFQYENRMSVYFVVKDRWLSDEFFPQRGNFNIFVSNEG